VVLTVAVSTPAPGPGVTRRQALAAGGGVAGLTGLAGCGLFDDDPGPPPAPDPLVPLRDAARTLAATYDRAIAAEPRLRDRLAPIATAHREHAAALDALIGDRAPSAAASGAPAAGAPRTGLADLRAAERAAQKDAAAACRTAPAGRAALVGSIAAARACHAEALR
jgi:hypothetical protein